MTTPTRHPSTDPATHRAAVLVALVVGLALGTAPAAAALPGPGPSPAAASAAITTVTLRATRTGPLGPGTLASRIDSVVRYSQSGGRASISARSTADRRAVTTGADQLTTDVLVTVTGTSRAGWYGAFLPEPPAEQVNDAIRTTPTTVRLVTRSAPVDGRWPESITVRWDASFDYRPGMTVRQEQWATSRYFGSHYTVKAQDSYDLSDVRSAS